MRPLMTDEDIVAASYAGFDDELQRWISFACKILAAWAPVDAELLEWAARGRRVLVTHDANSMTRHAYARVGAGEPMAGVIVAAQDLSIGHLIDFTSWLPS